MQYGLVVYMLHHKNNCVYACVHKVSDLGVFAVY